MNTVHDIYKVLSIVGFLFVLISCFSTPFNIILGSFGFTFMLIPCVGYFIELIVSLFKKDKTT